MCIKTHSTKLYDNEKQPMKPQLRAYLHVTVARRKCNLYAKLNDTNDKGMI